MARIRICRLAKRDSLLAMNTPYFQNFALLALIAK
jgi:hypothetical protein